jgi:hypothetical protein
VLLTVLVVGALGTAAVTWHTGPLVRLARTIGIGRPHRLLAAVTPARPSDDYAILHKDITGEPVTYDPCKPIHYAINPDGAPPDYLSFILPAVAAAQQASGLEFVYDGVSTDAWDSRQKGTSTRPVLIAFLDKLESPTASSDAVGLGGSSWLELDGPVRPHYLTGSIALKRSWFAEESGEHRTADEQSVVMHELGHVLGLDHVDDHDEVMYPSSHGQTSYGPGDLAGLALLGDGTCSN